MTKPPHQVKETITTITEKQFRQQIIDLMKIFGWKYYFTWSSIHSPAGFPDMVAIRDKGNGTPPRLVFAELKVKGNQPTSAQQEWLDLLGQIAQVESHLWRETDWSEIMEVLS